MDKVYLFHQSISRNSTFLGFVNEKLITVNIMVLISGLFFFYFLYDRHVLEIYYKRRRPVLKWTSSKMLLPCDGALFVN